MRPRQGIGVWSYSVQVSEPSQLMLAGKGKTLTNDELKNYALSHPGDPKKGAALFFDPKGIGCVKCHAAGGRGTANVGPDLTGLALKYDTQEIIKSVLEPSNRIATGYQPVIVAREDGSVLTGLLKTETETYLDLVDVETKVTRVPKGEIDERKVGSVSVMPTGLTESLTLEEFADLSRI